MLRACDGPRRNLLHHFCVQCIRHGLPTSKTRALAVRGTAGPELDTRLRGEALAQARAGRRWVTCNTLAAIRMRMPAAALPLAACDCRCPIG